MPIANLSTTYIKIQLRSVLMMSLKSFKVQLFTWGLLYTIVQSIVHPDIKIDSKCMNKFWSYITAAL